MTDSTTESPATPSSHEPPETLTDQQVAAAIAKDVKTTLRIVLVTIGGRTYKREADGLFHLLGG